MDPWNPLLKYLLSCPSSQPQVNCSHPAACIKHGSSSFPAVSWLQHKSSTIHTDCTKVTSTAFQGLPLQQHTGNPGTHPVAHWHLQQLPGVQSSDPPHPPCNLEQHVITALAWHVTHSKDVQAAWPVLASPVCVNIIQEEPGCSSQASHHRHAHHEPCPHQPGGRP